MKTQYWGRKETDTLKRKLESIEQYAELSAASLELRVQDLHNSIMNAYDQDPSVVVSDRDVLNQMAIKEARDQILCGLRPELEPVTRMTQPNTLAEPIDAVLAHESNHGLRNPKRAHVPTEDDQFEANARFATVNDRYNFGSTAPRIGPAKYLICGFCNKSGHETSECRSLRRKIINENENSLQNPNPNQAISTD